MQYLHEVDNQAPKLSTDVLKDYYPPEKLYDSKL